MWLCKLGLYFLGVLYEVLVCNSLQVEDHRCIITIYYKPWRHNGACERKYVDPPKLRQAAIQHCGITEYEYLQSYGLHRKTDYTRQCRDDPKAPKFSHISFACCKKPDKDTYNPHQCIFKEIAYSDRTCQTREDSKNWFGVVCFARASRDPRKSWSLTNWQIDESECERHTLKVTRYSCCEIPNFAIDWKPPLTWRTTRITIRRTTLQTLTTPITTTTTTTTTTRTTTKSLTPTPTITKRTTTTLTITPSKTIRTSEAVTSGEAATKHEAVFVSERPTLGSTERLRTAGMSSDTLIGLILGGIFGSIILVFIAVLICIQQRNHRVRLEELIKSYIQLAEGTNSGSDYPAEGDRYEIVEVTTVSPTHTRPARPVNRVIEMRQASPPPPDIRRTVSRRKLKKDGTVTEKVTTERIVHDDGGSVTDLNDATSIDRPRTRKRNQVGRDIVIVDDDEPITRRRSSKRKVALETSGSQSTIGSRRKKSVKRRQMIDDDNTEMMTTVKKRRRSPIRQL